MMSVISEQPKTISPPDKPVGDTLPKKQTWKEFYDELWVRISAHQKEHGITQPLPDEEVQRILYGDNE